MLFTHRLSVTLLASASGLLIASIPPLPFTPSTLQVFNLLDFPYIGLPWIIRSSITMIFSYGFLFPLLGLLTLLAFTLAIPDRPYIGPRCVTSRECGHNGLCASDSHCTCPLGYSPHRNWTTCNPVFCMSDYDCEIRWPNTVCHRNTSNRCGCLLFYHLDSAQLTCQLSEAVYISAAACAIGLFLCTALGVLFYTLARRHARKGKKIKKKVIRHY